MTASPSARMSTVWALARPGSSASSRQHKNGHAPNKKGLMECHTKQHHIVVHKVEVRNCCSVWRQVSMHKHGGQNTKSSRMCCAVTVLFVVATATAAAGGAAGMLLHLSLVVVVVVVLVLLLLPLLLHDRSCCHKVAIRSHALLRCQLQHCVLVLLAPVAEAPAHGFQLPIAQLTSQHAIAAAGAAAANTESPSAEHTLLLLAHCFCCCHCTRQHLPNCHIGATVQAAAPVAAAAGVAS